MKKRINYLLWMFLLATFAQAAYVAEKPNGEGTKEKPYEISKLENLLWMSENIRELEPGAYYSQTCDIDASETANWRDGLGFPPIGVYEDNYYSSNKFYFTGIYDGNNYVINGLTIKAKLDNFARGLFGGISNAFLCNIKLDNVKFTPRGGCGSLVGIMQNSNVSNCHARVTFYEFEEDPTMVGQNGGLIGHIYYSGSIIRCSAESEGLRGDYIGGLFADETRPTSLLIPYKFVVSECFTKGNIGDGKGFKIGGIAGSTSAKCINCYSWCNVSGEAIVGGFAGECGEVENCYVYGKISEGGKAISSGRYEGKGVYYCSDNGSEDDRATGKTYAEMTHQATFEGWDFDNVWDIEEGESLPTLQWEAPEPGLAFLLLSMLVVPLARKKE